MKQPRNKRGQFIRKEQPTDRLASLLFMVVVLLALGAIFVNITGLNKKMFDLQEQIDEIIEHQEEFMEEVIEEVEELVEEIKEEVVEVKKEVKKGSDRVGSIIKQNDYWAIEEVAEKVCKEFNQGDYCVADILGVAYAEHHDFNCSQLGDGNQSRGCFQIHLGIHKHITPEQADDIEWSARWTLNRLISKNYPVYRSIAIRSHNGNPYTDRTKPYLDTVNKFAFNY